MHLRHHTRIFESRQVTVGKPVVLASYSKHMLVNAAKHLLAAQSKEPVREKVINLAAANHATIVLAEPVFG